MTEHAGVDGPIRVRHDKDLGPAPEPVDRTGRRSRIQIAKDETAVVAIADLVKAADRWDVVSLRTFHDAVGDVLVEAGRL